MQYTQSHTHTNTHTHNVRPTVFAAFTWHRKTTDTKEAVGGGAKAPEPEAGRGGERGGGGHKGGPKNMVATTPIHNHPLHTLHRRASTHLLLKLNARLLCADCAAKHVGHDIQGAQGAWVGFRGGLRPNATPRSPPTPSPTPAPSWGTHDMARTATAERPSRDITIQDTGTFHSAARSPQAPHRRRTGGGDDGVLDPNGER